METTYLYDDTGPYLEKDPAAVLDYPFNWVDWLEAGDTLSTTTVTVTGGTLVSSAIAGTRVIAWVSGGVLGQWVEVRCKIKTALLREDTRTMRLRVVKR